MQHRIAMISEHASPIASLGSVDSGGQNVYVAQVARYLSRWGYQVDVFTRKDDPSLAEVMEWSGGVRVIHVPAGPAEFVPKEKLLPYMDDFTVRKRADVVTFRFCRGGADAFHLRVPQCHSTPALNRE